MHFGTYCARPTEMVTGGHTSLRYSSRDVILTTHLHLVFRDEE